MIIGRWPVGVFMDTTSLIGFPLRLLRRRRRRRLAAARADRRAPAAAQCQLLRRSVTHRAPIVCEAPATCLFCMSA